MYSLFQIVVQKIESTYDTIVHKDSFIKTSNSKIIWTQLEHIKKFLGHTSYKLPLKISWSPHILSIFLHSMV
jgi:hypothetical protein